MFTHPVPLPAHHPRAYSLPERAEPLAFTAVHWAAPAFSPAQPFSWLLDPTWCPCFLVIVEPALPADGCHSLLAGRVSAEKSDGSP